VRLKWLSTQLVTGPYLTLVTSEDEYKAALKYHKCTSDDPWVKWRKSACCHILTDEYGNITAIVALDADDATLSEVAGVLTHEAVHAWQHYCEHIGEDNPSDEFEAYAIQHIAQSLFSEYLKRQEKQ